VVSSIRSKPFIKSDLLLPDLLRAHPEARAVFDRYGLRGCGGRFGPYESILFFARAHGVDEARLLAELEQAIDGAKEAALPTSSFDTLADTIYRRYFIGGIVLVLTAGATWGAWILWQIALRGTFRNASLNTINAHGEAQIFGWVGLFIMGFAYQAFPRIWHTTLARPRLAAWCFALMVAGIILRTAGLATAGAWSLAIPVAMAGGILQLVAVAIFGAQIIETFVRSGMKIEPYAGFVMGALGWFVLSSAFSVWHTWTTLNAHSETELLWYVATYQVPLRDLQIHGLALFMILGVSLRMLPALFGLPQISQLRAWWALDFLTTAVVGETILFLLYRWTGDRAFAAGLPVPWMMLFFGVLVLTQPWRLWRPFPESDRSSKFIRTAFAWLAVSLVMLLLLPAYQLLRGVNFSHAYFGATRHAITVGFISLMIMGMAAKVVPTLNGIDHRHLTKLWGPFLLVNAGCLLRVATQPLTDWSSRVYPFLGVSGTLEVAGLAWWGAGLIGIIWQGKSGAGLEQQPQEPRPARIELRHHVADVLDWFPQTEPVFVRYGFTALKQPLLRRTLARQVTLSQAAAVRGISAAELVAALNASISERIHNANGSSVLSVLN